MRRGVLAVAAIVVVAAASAAQGQAKMTHFEFKPLEATSAPVTLTGDWVGWNPAAISMKPAPGGAFAAEVAVPEGRRLYKFVIEGKRWYHDAANPDREADGQGGFNSVRVVGHGDAKLPAPAKPAGNASPPVTYDVSNVPESFKADWIPVKFSGGSLLVFSDQAPEGKGQLLLSRGALSNAPKKKGGESSTAGSLASRQIFVWLPAGYAAAENSRYPVIYLHDGQNVWDDAACCFGHGGWGLNTTMDTMTTLPRAILVGIPNSAARMAEYGLGADILALQETDYLRFVRDVVKPAVDKSFRTMPDAPHTTIMGSSMGGVISIFAAYKNPDVFGNVVAMSTAFQVPDAHAHTLIDLLEKSGPGKFRLYLDNGTGGAFQDGAPMTREFARIAQEKGWAAKNEFVHLEDPGADHNEKAWRAPRVARTRICAAFEALNGIFQFFEHT